MSERIEAKEIALADLFGPKFMFTIPVYQRPLSWTVENFDILFEDIAGAKDNDLGQYFLGSILLQEFSKDSYYLVDGQQRLSSVAILLAVIRDNSQNTTLRDKVKSYLYQEKDVFKEIPEVMRITPWEDLKDLFRNYVYELDGTKKFLGDFGTKIKYSDQEDPKYHLFEAITTFKKKIENCQDIDAFVKYLLNKVFMVYIKTSSQTSAFRLFTVMNSRGMPLDPSDLLKAESLEAIQDPTTRERYARTWRDIEDEIGREDLGNLIAYMRTIETKTKAELGIYDEFQKIFRGKVLVKGVQFIDYLKEINEIYQKGILDGEVETKDRVQKNDYKVTVDLMERFIPFSDWIPPLLAFHYKFRTKGGIPEFLTKFERKVALEWAIGLSPTERITSLNKVIQLIDDNVDPFEVVKKVELPKKQDAEPLLVSRLNDSQMYWIYGGKLSKYLLLRIDKEFWEMENFAGYPGSVTVEHVLPQTTQVGSVWRTWFSDKERDQWTNRLGNLTLLSGRKNSEAQNYDFARKKSVYFGKKGTAFKITQQLDRNQVWKLEQVNRRQEEFVDIVKGIYLA